MHSSCLRAALTLFLPLAFTTATLPAQQGHAKADEKYTIASVCGNYGAIATYGANIARALGFEIMDGHGHITGAALANQPGPGDTTRSLASIGISGTYTVNAQGMGKMNLSILLPSGATADVVEDFVITKSKVVDGVEIATEIQDAQEVPSAVIDDSSLVIHTYTLRGTPKPCGVDH